MKVSLFLLPMFVGILCSLAATAQRYDQGHRSTQLQSRIFSDLFKWILRILGIGSPDPAPTSSAPSSASPVTAAPVTTSPPITVSPVTAPPITSSPVTAAPMTTSAPITASPATTSPQPPSGTISTCTCQSCNATALAADAYGVSCGDRINYLKTEMSQLFPTEAAACARVAEIEYFDECRLCDPSSCDGRAPLPPTRDSFCGCTDSCTFDVWKSKANNGLSCEALVTWVQLTDPSRGLESDACQLVADQFPDSPCGKLCNPSTCSEPCFCASCTSDVLNRGADGFTCGSRISFLESPQGGSESQRDACVKVAQTQFPDLCGPQCDPDRCQPACGCASCTQAVLDRLAGEYTCGARIAFLRSVDGGSLLERNACIQIAKSDYQDVCGPCDPTNCSISPPPTPDHPFGSNVMIFDATMPTSFIQNAFDVIYTQQVNNEMGSERHSMFFMPGTYGSVSNPLQIKVGYYTEIAGLGLSPQDVKINGKIEVYNRCFVEDAYNKGKFIPTSAEAGVCFALNNFWRSISNLSINIIHAAGTGDCRRVAMFWAISQASSMRRVEINGGDLSLMDFCTSMLLITSMAFPWSH
jgi:hypothetical protein